jgi:phosphopantetheinyl transferase
MPSQRLAYELGAHGKPFLRSPATQPLTSSERTPTWRWQPELQPVSGPQPPIQFSLTHTHGIAGVAVAPAGWAVGLDVERAGRVPTHGVLPVARKLMAPSELALLQGMSRGFKADVGKQRADCCCAGCTDEHERSLLFSKLWVAKEAVVKARGSGILASPGFKDFAIGAPELHSCAAFVVSIVPCAVVIVPQVSIVPFPAAEMHAPTEPGVAQTLAALAPGSQVSSLHVQLRLHLHAHAGEAPQQLPRSAYHLVLFHPRCLVQLQLQLLHAT